MSKPPPMGHNGFFFETREDLPADLPKLYYARFTLQDVLDDVLRMPKEERGVYMTALMVMYKEMGSLPADDKQAAMMMGLDVREWRHIKPKLYARGVLYQTASGRVSNRRFEAEICAYVTEFKNRREAAIEREQKRRQAAKIAGRSPTDRREIADRSPTDRREIAGISPTSSADLGDHFSGKPNKNNEATTTRQAQGDHKAAVRARDSLATSYESVVKTHTHTRCADALGVGDDEGPLDPKIARAIEMMAPHFGSASDPDPDESYRVMTKWAAAYSPQAVLDAALDFDGARRIGHQRAFILNDTVFGSWVRQADIDRQRRIAEPNAERPAHVPKRVPPGEFAEGFVMGEDGRVALINGKRAEWLERFGDNERLLDVTLIEASARIRLNAHTPPAAQVEAHLAGKCRDIVTRRENAKEAAKARYDAEYGAAAMSTETDQERTARLVEEALRNG